MRRVAFVYVEYFPVVSHLFNIVYLHYIIVFWCFQKRIKEKILYFIRKLMFEDNYEAFTYRLPIPFLQFYIALCTLPEIFMYVYIINLRWSNVTCYHLNVYFLSLIFSAMNSCLTSVSPKVVSTVKW